MDFLGGALRKNTLDTRAWGPGGETTEFKNGAAGLPHPQGVSGLWAGALQEMGPWAPEFHV